MRRWRRNARRVVRRNVTANHNAGRVDVELLLCGTITPARYMSHAMRKGKEEQASTMRLRHQHTVSIIRGGVSNAAAIMQI